VWKHKIHRPPPDLRAFQPKRRLVPLRLELPRQLLPAVAGSRAAPAATPSTAELGSCPLAAPTRAAAAPLPAVAGTRPATASRRLPGNEVVQPGLRWFPPWPKSVPPGQTA
jgi:hypothetical protein